MAFWRAQIKFVRAFTVVDAFLFLGLILSLYALIGVAEEWASPYHPVTEIELGGWALFKYSIFSLVRVVAAYILSLGFTFTYGYVAAKSKIAEPILIPLLDILQSIPVLGFMPGLVLALVHLFPHSNMGLEIAAVIMIFTGEGWNMVFSFYSSLKNLPVELREVTTAYRLRKWALLRQVEIPYAMNGLLWNSMLSMAGGWFYLMTIESQTVGGQNFRLPGIGSYMAVAYERNDVGAVVAGIAAMFLLIFLVDRCVWAPLVVWSERFKYEPNANRPVQTSVVLDLLKRSRIIDHYFDVRDVFIKEWKKWFTPQRAEEKKRSAKAWRKRGVAILWVLRIFFVLAGIVGTIWGIKSMYTLLAATNVATWVMYLKNICFTFVRVCLAVVIGSLWAIPVGVFIGTNPKWTSRLQPVVQIVASFPAPMLFPILAYVMAKMGLSFEIGACVLFLFASQWYILFNVISGAVLIPRHMIELGYLFRLKGWHYWKAIILPAIFPSLVNGWITAAGGAWNASIVAEIVQQGKNVYVATGIGSVITQSANQGDFPTLAGGILVMVTVVVLLNRLFWGSLYRLAETRYRLES
jgi:NitT/TauT family transport system permease protein